MARLPPAPSSSPKPRKCFSVALPGKPPPGGGPARWSAAPRASGHEPSNNGRLDLHRSEDDPWSRCRFEPLKHGGRTTNHLVHIRQPDRQFFGQSRVVASREVLSRGKRKRPNPGFARARRRPVAS